MYQVADGGCSHNPKIVKICFIPSKLVHKYGLMRAVEILAMSASIRKATFMIKRIKHTRP